jgi:fermentation-respiration switch protein FrsA (DUF1100 family)
MYLFQRQFIYFPDLKKPSRQVFHAEDMQVLTLKTEDRFELNAWFKPALANQPTVLYLHGNAGHIGYRIPLVRQFLSQGFGGLLLDYRGYGGNPGKPSEEGLYRDARAAMLFLAQKEGAVKRLVLYGESLGTGVAVKMASEFPICALILQAPFTSLQEVARYHYPWLFLRPWDRYNSLALIPRIKVPLLVLHGKQDEIIPFEQGLRLFNQANEPKSMIALDMKGHNDLWNDNFVTEVIRFIQSRCS